MKKIMSLILFSLSMQGNAWMPLDHDPLAWPDSYHIIQLEDELFMVHNAIDDAGASDYRVYNFQGTISIAGLYRLVGDLSQNIIISTDNVTLDLGGHTIESNVLGAIGSANNNNITIRNGTVKTTGSVIAGIQVTFGNNILLEDLAIDSFSFSLFLNGINDGRIKNCKISNSTSTGVTLQNSHNIVVDNTVVMDARLYGYDLISSTTCILTNCQAVSTGSSNVLTSADIFGFRSTDGNGNIFERCIANATQGLAVTDFSSVVAGFGLLGTESCSKIVGCTASNAQTALSGVTVPYGIMLEAQVDSSLTLTAFPQVPQVSTNVFDVSWSPDMNYLVEGETNGALLLYKFDAQNFVFTQVDSDDDTTAALRSVAFDPSGEFVATAPVTVSESIRVYALNRFNDTLEFVAISETVGQVNGSLAWDPTGNYIAIAEQTGTPELLKVFKFDRVNYSLSLVASVDPAGGQLLGVAWSPDGRFIAVGAVSIAVALNIFAFQNNTLSFVDSSSIVTLRSLDWSPDGKYILVGSDSTFYIFSVASDGNITQVRTFSAAAQYAQWSPDGKYFALANTTNTTVRMYLWDRLTNTETLVATSATITLPDTVNGMDWSPDGQFINARQFTFRALTFPLSNVIKDNIVYCNVGGSQPRAIGISGSTLNNLIIGNTCYSNPPQPFMVQENYAFVTNVFNQNFGQGPTAVQNISIDGPICTPADLDLMAQQIEAKLCDIQTKIDSLIP